jgi:hypothetical protein
LLKPRVIITTYNPHVGSFSRVLVVSAKTTLLGPGADLVMQSQSAPRTSLRTQRQPLDKLKLHHYRFFPAPESPTFTFQRNRP